MATFAVCPECTVKPNSIINVYVGGAGASSTVEETAGGAGGGGGGYNGGNGGIGGNATLGEGQGGTSYIYPGNLEVITEADGGTGAGTESPGSAEICYNSSNSLYICDPSAEQLYNPGFKTYVQASSQLIPEVYKLGGELVFKKQVDNEKVTSFNTSNLASGVYIVVINKGESLRFVVK